MSVGNHVAVVSWLLFAFQNATHQIDTVYTQFRIVVERLLLEALLLRLNMLCDLIGTRIGLVKAVRDSFGLEHWATRHHSSILFSFQLISVYLFIAILLLLIQILFRCLRLMRLSLDYVVHHYVLIVGQPTLDPFRLLHGSRSLRLDLIFFYAHQVILHKALGFAMMRLWNLVVLEWLAINLHLLSLCSSLSKATFGSALIELLRLENLWLVAHYLIELTILLIVLVHEQLHHSLVLYGVGLLVWWWHLTSLRCHCLVAYHFGDIICHLVLLLHSHVLLLVHENVSFLSLCALIYGNLMHLNLLLSCILEHCHLFAVGLRSSDHLDGVFCRSSRTTGHIQHLTIIQDLNRVCLVELYDILRRLLLNLHGLLLLMIRRIRFIRFILEADEVILALCYISVLSIMLYELLLLQ